MSDPPIVVNHEFIGFHEFDAEKVKGCTPVILNRLHADGLRDCVRAIGECAGDYAARTANFELFSRFLAIYSTESRLLDPLLPELVGSLVSLIDLKREEGQRFSVVTEEAFSFLRSLTLVCHYKVVSSLLPHDVKLLEPLLSALEFYTTPPNITSYMIYGLQAWLYIVCKNPFDLARLAKEHAQVATGLDSLTQRLIACLMAIQKSYTTDTSFYRLTPNFLAQILTRNRDNSAVLQPLFAETIEIFRSKEQQHPLLLPRLSLLSSIFKFGKRAELRKYADEILGSLQPFSFTGGPACYFGVKLFQRLALAFLPPKLAAWRYKCGYRSLEANLAAREQNGVKQNGVHKPVAGGDHEQEGEEVDEKAVQKVLGLMHDVFLRTLQDKMNDVRMTSAKTIGRICARLSKEQTAEIIARILADNFDPNAPASSWHGGCLALAELSSRGCFLPEQLGQVIPLICDALIYDKQCNGNVTESNVRDAACYIRWAFARAYEIDVLREHCDLLAKRLVCTALFDREVNVRRAASASFQENVGRHGGFVDGIQVLVLIDFTAVGIIRHCYEAVCVQVAHFSAYTRPMIDHLREITCVHWDERLRLLAATAIERLVVFDEEYALNTMLPEFCTRLNASRSFADMQGYLVAIAAIVQGLHSKHKAFFDDSELLRSVSAFIFKNAAQMRQLTQRNVSFLIKSACVFIETIAATDLRLDSSQLAEANDVLEFTLQNPIEQIRDYGERALSSFFAYYWKHGHSELLVARIRKYTTEVSNSNSELSAAAWIIAIRCVPAAFLAGEEGAERTAELLKVAAQTILQPLHDHWYNVKIEAVRTITRLLQLNPKSSAIDWELVFSCFFACVTDRTRTKQGDVGRYVRSAALNSMTDVLLICEENGELSESRLDQAIALVIQRCSDTVDKTRASAFEAMRRLLKTPLPIKGKKEVAAVFEEVSPEVEKGLAFLSLDRLLLLTPYRPLLLRGLIESMASILAWTAEHAQKIMMRHLEALKEDRKKMEAFVDELMAIGEESTDEGDLLSFTTALQRMLADGAFSAFEANPDESPAFRRLCQFVLATSLRKSRPRLRHVAIQTLGTLMIVQFDSEVGREVRLRLVSFLSSAYAGVRAMAADQLQETLNLANEEVYERPAVQEAIALLTETNWNNSNQLEELKEKVARLNELLA